MSHSLTPASLPAHTAREAGLLRFRRLGLASLALSLAVSGIALLLALAHASVAHAAGMTIGSASNAAAAPAATVCVDPAGGGCYTTIQAAVNAAVSGDTISIAAGTYVENVSITGKILTFLGAGAAATIVDGNGAGRVLHSTSGIALADLTIRNGSATGNGGGLYITGTATLNNVNVLSNTAVGNGGGAYVNGAATVTGGLYQQNTCSGATCLGGGMYTTGAAVTLNGTQFISNTAFGVSSNRSGGGLFAFSTATVIGGLFQQNSCTAAGCSGGGLFANGSLTLTNTQLISNTAVWHGGGIYVNGDAALDDGLFQGNGCTGSGCIGGGLYTTGLMLTSTQFLNNTALGSGGGAYAHGNAAVTGGLFQGNACTVSGCTGGGLVAGARLALTGTQFLGNTATAGGTAKGGGLYLQGSRAVMVVNALFAGNAATSSGAAIYNYSTGAVTVLHTTIAGPAVGAGTAIYVQRGSLAITNTIVASYTTGIQAASGIPVTSDYNLFLSAPTSIVTGSHSLSGDQYLRFADAAAGDYRPALGSPAPAHGLNLGVLTDLDGTTRGDPPTIGAYEGTPYPNLWLSKSVSPATRAPYPGGVVTYSLDLANYGSLTDVDVRVTDTLPADVTFGGWVSVSGSASHDGGAITWTTPVTDLMSSTLVFTVAYSGDYGAVITNTAWFSGTGQSGSATAAFQVEGFPVCFATPDDGVMVYRSDDGYAVQQAVDAASAGGTVKVAGSCAGTQSRSGSNQVAYVAKALTLAGGYTTTNWITADPTAQPTLLDALGGGRSVYATAALTLIDLTIQNGSGGQGGGIYGNSNAPLTLRNVNVLSNTASNSGGGVYANAAATISGGQFQGNLSTGFGSGGGLYARSALTVTGTRFIGNTATGNGGGIYHTNAGVGRVVNALFARNAVGSAYQGAALYLSSPGAVGIVNTTIVSPTQGVRSAIYVNNATATVNVTNTVVASYTTGIQRANGTVTQDYNLFYGVTNPTTGTVSGGSHSLTDGDPRFLDATSDDYHLAAGSAAIEAGTNDGCPATDLDGMTRPQGSACDIGAYEREQHAAVALSKAAAPGTEVAHQGLVTYTLVLSNTGGAADPQVFITDTLPAQVQFARWIEQAGAVRTDEVITWNGAVAAGETITVAFAITNTASGSTTITNTADFSGSAQAGSASASYTTTANLYPSGSGNWDEVFPPCTGVCKYMIPAGVAVTLTANITLTGDLEVEAGGTLNANGQTVTLTGDQPQTLTGDPLTFYNLVVDKTANDPKLVVTIDGKLKVTKKLTVRSGKLVSASDYEDIEIEAGGELALTSGITVGGHFTNSGTLTTNSYGITFDGSKAQNLTLNDWTTFDAITVTLGTTLVETVSGDHATVGTLTNHGIIRKTQAVGAAETYYFGLAGKYNDADLEIAVTDLTGSDPLTAIQVDHVAGDHAGRTGAAGHGVGWGHYWTITPTGSDFVADVTLPHDVAVQANAKACRFGSGTIWDCRQNAVTADTVTYQNTTHFSDWAVGVNASANAVRIGRLVAAASPGGALAALVALLLVVVGGLVFWRRRGGHAEA